MSEGSEDVVRFRPHDLLVCEPPIS